MRFPLTGDNLSLDAVRRLCAPEPPRLTLPAAARKRVKEAAAFVESLKERTEPV